MEISPSVHLVPGVRANPYLIADPDGLTLIDTGLPGSQKKILDYIVAIGHRPEDVRRIILTHSDGDHVGALAALKKATGARVYASAIEAAAIARGQSSRPPGQRPSGRKLLLAVARRLFRIGAAQTDEIVVEGQILPVLGGLRVIETPGHTPGHISLFSASAGVLFTGDSIISHDGALTGSLPGFTWDRQKADESVRKQTALQPSVVCSGHGPVVHEAAAKMPVV